MILLWLCAFDADGFRVSEQSRLHVGGNIDLKYDSNPAFLPGDAVGDMALRVRALLNYTRPSETLELLANLAVDWTQYLGVSNPATRQWSSLQGAADFSLLANKQGKVTFYLTEQVVRIDTAANDSLTERLKSVRSYTRIGTDLRPGGGALEIRAQYGLDFIYFDDSQRGGSVSDPRALTHMTHSPALRGMWRFFPKTALTLDADGAFTRYPLSNSYDTPALNALRVQAGAIGLLAAKLTIVARAGYANTFSSAGSNFSNVIGHASVAWKPLDTTTLTGGYTRDFTPTSIFGWVAYDRPFVEFQQLFLQRFSVLLKAMYEHQYFGTPSLPDVQRERRDHVFRGEARLGWQALPWLSGSVYYIPDFRFTRFTSPNLRSGAYTRHLVGLDVTLAY